MLLEQFEAYEKKLDNVLAKHPLALQMERRLGQPKTRLAMYGALLVLSSFLFYFNADLAHALVACLLPSIATARYLYNHHIQRDSVKEEKRVSLWMTYWLVLGKMLVLEAMGVTRLIPMYGLVRIAFLIWLQAPGLEGAELVLNKALLPVLCLLFTRSGNEKLKQSASSLAKEINKNVKTSPKSPVRSDTEE